MAEVQPPMFLQGGAIQHDARGFRRILGGILSEGVARTTDTDNDMIVTVVSEGQTPVVSVAKGGCYIQGDQITDQGLYFCYNDGAEPITLDARPGGASRVDSIYAQVKDAFEGVAGDTWVLDKATGTTTIPASAIKLAEVTVPATGSLTVDDTKREKAGIRAVGASKIGTSQLIDGAVTADKMANGLATSAKINPTIARNVMGSNQTIANPGSSTTLCSMSLTSPVNEGRAIVWGVIDWQCQTGAEIYAWLTVDGVQQEEQAWLDVSTAGIRATTGQTWYLEGLASGAHTIALVATHAVGSGSLAIANNTNLTGIAYYGE